MQDLLKPAHFVHSHGSAAPVIAHHGQTVGGHIYAGETLAILGYEEVATRRIRRSTYGARRAHSQPSTTASFEPSRIIFVIFVIPVVVVESASTLSLNPGCLPLPPRSIAVMGTYFFGMTVVSSDSLTRFNAATVGSYQLIILLLAHHLMSSSTVHHGAHTHVTL